MKIIGWHKKEEKLLKVVLNVAYFFISPVTGHGHWSLVMATGHGHWSWSLVMVHLHIFVFVDLCERFDDNENEIAEKWVYQIIGYCQNNVPGHQFGRII